MMKFVVHKIVCNFWEGFYCCWSWRSGFFEKGKNKSLEIEKNQKKIARFLYLFQVGGGGEEKSNKSQNYPSEDKREGQRKAKRWFQVGSQKCKRIFFSYFLNSQIWLNRHYG